MSENTDEEIYIQQIEYLTKQLERQKKANVLLLTDATAKKVAELQAERETLIAEATSLRDTLAVVDRNLAEMTIERNKVVKKLDDWGQTYRDIIKDGTCLSDDYHCGCVPALREELGRVKAALGEYANHNNWAATKLGMVWMGKDSADGWPIAERALKGGEG